jgi:dolichol-phosphate mannosyltransferase
MQHKISIIIPTYNEKENIAILIPKVFQILRKSKIKGEIVIVDDNSPDGTGETAEKMKRNYNVKILHRKSKKGLSSAVINGFKIATGDILGVMDADLSHPPEIIPKLIKTIINDGFDVVVASRYVKGGGCENWSLIRKVESKGASLLARIVTNIKDPMSGFFFFKKNVIKNVELNPIGFKIGLEILVKGKYDKVKEVPYIFRNRKYGESKVKVQEYVNYLRHLYRLSIYNKALPQFIKFCVVGLIGTGVNLAILYFLVEFVNLWYIISATISFVIALTNNYILNRLWTFSSKEKIMKQYVKFFVVSVLSLGINLSILYLLVEFAHIWYIFAQVIAIIVALWTNFLGSKLWVFRKQ